MLDLMYMGQQGEARIEPQPSALEGISVATQPRMPFMGRSAPTDELDGVYARLRLQGAGGLGDEPAPVPRMTRRSLPVSRGRALCFCGSE